MRRCLLVFEPPDGGVAENVLRLALGLEERGWKAWVAGPERSIIHSRLEAAGIPVAKLPFERGYGEPAQDLRALRGLLGLMNDQFDVIHAHSAKAGVLGRIAARVKRTPIVYTPHCFPFVGPWGLPRRAFSVGIERALGPLTEAIICVAEAERGLALEKHVASPERLHVVHNGSLPCEEGLERDPELEALREAGPLAACLAVLRPQKAVHVFVEAAAFVLERLPEAQLAVVGNGEMRQDLERRARALGVDRRVRFLDFKPPASRQLRSIDVFVLPSAWEAFPISILEAMACGVPQVATDVGGTAEALEDGTTGLLGPANDPMALAERITTLLEDPERRAEMSEASRRRHARHFGLELMVERTVDIYDRVASG